LQEDAGAAGLPGEALGEVERRRPADVLPQVVFELFLELRVVAGLLVLGAELPERVHQRFRHETAAVGTEPAVNVGGRASRVRHESSPGKGWGDKSLSWAVQAARSSLPWPAAWRGATPGPDLIIETRAAPKGGCGAGAAGSRDRGARAAPVAGRPAHLRHP